MGLPHSNTTETWDLSDSIREDLSDIIYSIDSTETPFLMMAGRGSASAEKHEWLTDNLAAAALNHVEQGYDAVADAAIAPIRFANHSQISDKTISVTGTMEVTDKAGRSSELSYQLAKRAKELKRDLEFIMVGQTTVAGTASVAAATGGTAGRSGAVTSYFYAATMSTTSGTLQSTAHVDRIGTEGGFVEATDLLSAPGDGTQRALLESQLKGVIQGAWENGGDPTIVMAGAYNKTVISGFSGNSTRFDRGEDKRLVAAIDIYVSDFGEHRVVPNRFQRARDVFAFTPELWSVDYLRPFRQHALAKTGDSENRQLLCEWTLCGKNQSGNGIIADLTTS